MTRPKFLHLPRTRRGKIAAAASLLSVVAAVVAVALFIGRAPITGSVTPGAFTPEWVGASKITSGPDASADSCETPTISPSRQLVFGMTGAFPADKCTISGLIRVRADAGAVDGKVTGLDMAGLPANWTARIISGCGATITPGGPGVEVQFTVTVGPDAASDGVTRQLAASAGVLAMPSQQAPANPTCPAFAGQ